MKATGFDRKSVKKYSPKSFNCTDVYCVMLYFNP